MTPFKSPMLVSEIPGHQDRINAQPYVFVQPKLDGHCCMANTRTRRIYTRSGREITTLPHINAALPTTGPEWLHGELWKHGATCDSVSAMIRTGDTSLGLTVFDCVSGEGYSKRMTKAFNAIRDTSLRRRTLGPIDIISGIEITFPIMEGIKWAFESYLSDGYEGIIIRLDGHGYYHGRSQNVFKMKPGTDAI